MTTFEGGDERWIGRAPAKVNLILRILAREASGFHQLETVFQRLALADDVELSPGANGNIHLEVEGVSPDALGPTDRNLAVRAAQSVAGALKERGAPFPGLRIRLLKRIPAGAGLGGGSSDAATVLRGTNELLGNPLTLDELLDLGGRLGADVPFFLGGGPLALAWGRGDRLLPLPPLPVRPVLLALPPFSVETPWAYRMLAEHRERLGLRTRGAGHLSPRELSTWEGIASLASNEFEEALFPQRPELAILRDQLLAAGAQVALLSGSGSVVFGIFSNSEALRAGRAGLEEMGAQARLMESRTEGTEGT